MTLNPFQFFNILPQCYEHEVYLYNRSSATIKGAVALLSSIPLCNLHVYLATDHINYQILFQQTVLWIIIHSDFQVPITRTEQFPSVQFCFWLYDLTFYQVETCSVSSARQRDHQVDELRIVYFLFPRIV